MKATSFEYHRPASVVEASALLAQYDGDARALAGGQSLVRLRMDAAGDIVRDDLGPVVFVPLLSGMID